MVDIADDHYAIDIARARARLGWEPRNRLGDTLSMIVAALRVDPVGWYEANKLNAAKVAGRGEKARRQTSAHEKGAGHAEAMQQHMAGMAAMRRRMLWVHFLVFELGAWLLTDRKST